MAIILILIQNIFVLCSNWYFINRLRILDYLLGRPTPLKKSRITHSILVFEKLQKKDTVSFFCISLSDFPGRCERNFPIHIIHWQFLKAKHPVLCFLELLLKLPRFYFIYFCVFRNTLWVHFLQGGSFDNGSISK